MVSDELKATNNAKWELVVAALDGNEKVKRILHQKNLSLKSHMINGKGKGKGNAHFGRRGLKTTQT